MMTKNLKTAFFSALLVLAVAYPVLGLKLTTVGIKLEVHGASPAVLWTIAAVAVFMFFWQLFRDRLSAVWASAPSVRKPTRCTAAGTLVPSLPERLSATELAIATVRGAPPSRIGSVSERCSGTSKPSAKVSGALIRPPRRRS